MKSMVLIVWQFESKGITIAPTIIKNQNQPPLYYFYSLRKSRVLRKKNIPQNQRKQLNCSTELYQRNTDIIKQLILEYCGSSIHNSDKQSKFKIQQPQQIKHDKSEGFGLFICKNIYKNTKQISLKLYTVPQCIYWIQNPSNLGQFCLIKNAEKIVRVKFEILKSEVSSFVFVDIFSHYTQNYEAIKSVYQPILRQWGVHFMKQLFLSLKEGKSSTNQYKYQFNELKFEIDIILCLDVDICLNKTAEYDKIKLIETIKLNISKNGKTVHLLSSIDTSLEYQFINCAYNIENSTGILQNLQSENKQQQMVQFRGVNQQKQWGYMDKESQCKGCDYMTSQSMCKQLNVLDVRQLRRINGLSLRGLSEQYYLVCQTCYRQQIKL